MSVSRPSSSSSPSRRFPPHFTVPLFLCLFLFALEESTHHVTQGFSPKPVNSFRSVDHHLRGVYVTSGGGKDHLFSELAFGTLIPSTAGRGSRSQRLLTRGRRSAFLLSASSSPSSLEKKKKKKKHPYNKVEVDDLLRGMGLNPVPATAKTKKNERVAKESTSAMDIDDNNKVEMDDLLRGMGLNPVPATAMSKTKKNERVAKKSTSAMNMDDNKSSFTGKTIDIDLQTQLTYSREGHTVLRSFLPPDLLSGILTELEQFTSSDQQSLHTWRQKVLVASGHDVQKSESCSTVKDCQETLEHEYGIPVHDYGLPFLQYFNTWQSVRSVRDHLTHSPLLARAASQLMGIPRVRLYQDSLFLKRYDVDGKTPWHLDADKAPFDTSHMISFWIPLRDVPAPSDGGTGLYFVNKSHADIALPYWNAPTAEGGEYDRLDWRYGVDDAVQHYMPLDVGDVTVHSGWTLHCSDANTKGGNNGAGSGNAPRQDRYALAVTYVDARAEVRQDVLDHVVRLQSGMSNEKDTESRKSNTVAAETSSYKGDDEDMSSFSPWIRDVAPRTQFHHDLVPQIWPPLTEPSQ